MPQLWYVSFRHSLWKGNRAGWYVNLFAYSLRSSLRFLNNTEATTGAPPVAVTELTGSALPVPACGRWGCRQCKGGPRANNTAGTVGCGGPREDTVLCTGAEPPDQGRLSVRSRLSRWRPVRPTRWLPAVGERRMFSPRLRIAITQQHEVHCFDSRKRERDKRRHEDDEEDDLIARHPRKAAQPHTYARYPFHAEILPTPR